jgi:hypothetical protein
MIGKRLSKLLGSASLLTTILATLGFFEIPDEIGRYHLVDGKTSYRIGSDPFRRNGGESFLLPVRASPMLMMNIWRAFNAGSDGYVRGKFRILGRVRKRYNTKG